MAPLRESSSWTSRYKENDGSENELVEIDPLKRYYLIFEGAHTELKYFEGIADNRKYLGINNFIELIILVKEGNIENYSNPKKLLELIKIKKEELKNDGNFDDEIDRFVIVFDRDSFKTSKDYFEYINSAKLENILAVTSPCFELWLLLHHANSVNIDILCNEEKVLHNKRVSNKHTYMSKLISDRFGINPKSNLQFEKFKENIGIAIGQEKLLTQDVEGMVEKLGSNIGALIEELMKDPRKAIF